MLKEWARHSTHLGFLEIGRQLGFCRLKSRQISTSLPVASLLDRTRSGYFDFAHIILMKELVLTVVPFDSYARPVAGTYRALIVGAVMASNALTYLEAFGLGRSHLLRSQSKVSSCISKKWNAALTKSPIRRELIFSHYAFEVFGPAFFKRHLIRPSDPTGSC